MKPIEWDIRREGRRWSNDEFDQRIYQAPEKIEYVNGIFASDRQRLNVLGMLLFFDLFAMFREALDASDEQTLRRIFDFAEWCFCQGRRAPDLNNAVCVCFYEHVFDVAHRDWADVARWLSPAVIGACSTLWEERQNKDEIQKLDGLLTATHYTGGPLILTLWTI